MANGSAAATPPAAEKETVDPQVRALADSVGRLDAAVAKLTRMVRHSRRDDDDDDRKDAARSDDDDDRKDAARSDDDRKDDKYSLITPGRRLDDDDDDRKDARRRDDDDDDRKDARKRKDDKDIEEWAKEEKGEPEHKEKPESLASDAKKGRKDDDDDRKDAARSDDDDDDRKDAARSDDDDDRKDARRRDDDDDRKDARRRDRQDSQYLTRRLDELERQLARRDRQRSDEETDAIAVAQQEWDKVAMAHGERVLRPMDGEGAVSYERRNARRFQRFSPRWKGIDLAGLPREVLALASPEIRTDAVKAAYQPEQNAPPVLREVRRRDRTGREISEFIGPVAATLEPFRLPAMRVRKINTQPTPY